METNNKYYTPELSEFHVGFEFETNYMQKEWVKEKLEFDDFGFYSSTWEVDSCPTEFRVKRLDYEDIESFGILYRGKTNSIINVDVFVLLTPEKRFTLKINFPISKVEITVEDAIYEPNNKNTLFLGIIKNISELKKLIVQLNIK